MESGSHELREDVDRLLARFSVAASSDRQVEWTIRALAALTIACAVAAFLFLVVGIEMFEIGRRTRLLVGGVLLALAVLFGWRWRVYRNRDMDDRKLEAIRKLLSILRADIPRDAPVTLTIDLRHYDRGGASVTRAGRVTKYKDAWLAAAVPLADGNVLTLGVTDGVTRKRKRRGTRVRGRTRVDLALRLAHRYGEGTDAAHSLRRRPAPAPLRTVTVTSHPAGTGTRARLEARLDAQAVAGDSPVGGNELLAAVRWAYAGLAQARRQG